jgi:hypothetical protein
MSALKPKATATTTITLRIPVATKQQIDRLRPIADDKGFDVNLSLIEAIVRCTKQIADELGDTPTTRSDLYTKRTQNHPDAEQANGSQPNRL